MRFLYNKYKISLEEQLDKANSSTINDKRSCFLCVDIYKAINDLDPSFMKHIFELRETNEMLVKDTGLI